ncbi:hypothetical protein [Agrobacterium pusense]|uniref:hypothetical protein n=1 Tax=Agrobacterium pusense TaxID=648995 RepID=UPI00345E1726
MKRQTDPAITELMKRPLSERARGFLRHVKSVGGRLDLSALGLAYHIVAEECRSCGYLHITADGETAKLTGLGQAYLDRLMRSH